MFLNIENIKNLLLKAINVSIIAGEKIIDVYNSSDYKILSKEDNSPLTIADKRAHDVIYESLLETKIPILSEEGKIPEYDERKMWEYFWLVDPLDGTKEFIKRNGEFTVNIALIHKKDPVAGVIYIPVTKELYFGGDSLGAFKAKINVNDEFSNIKTFDDYFNISQKLPFKHKARKYTVVGSKSHLSDETKAYFKQLEQEHNEIDIISKGSSLKLCMLAEGRADIYPRFGLTSEWDTAAGHAILNASGGSLKKINGEDFCYNKKNILNPYFIARKQNL